MVGPQRWHRDMPGVQEVDFPHVTRCSGQKLLNLQNLQAVGRVKPRRTQPGAAALRWVKPQILQ